MPDLAIEVRDVVKHYRTPGRGDVHALDGVSVAVEPGRVLGIVGESGCGKSTLARLLTRLERPDAGRIDVLGQSLATARGQRAARAAAHDPTGVSGPVRLARSPAASGRRAHRGP